ncbi:hypothetical protein E1B28_001713 [Marasmius oreades]|uniref:DPH-type MB domain-containing protein n=1 Tax=Marasmius oreades TaxID=181124 RepID=A0A9P8AG02_9AGAR|nr:uncharacterized protein E1B28_001713 [Marasmius oreades]KAG7099915.1 hypothetical protein E1B28_001713 [Marasmius oreades]
MAYETLSLAQSRLEYDSMLDEHKKPSATPRPAQVISLEEFEEDGGIWHHPCRCGGSYSVSEEDMEKNIHLSGCDGCSEVVWVGFEVLEVLEGE